MTLILLIAANTIFTASVLYLVRQEAKRRRILQAFIAGIIRSITDYISRTDTPELTKPLHHNTEIPISYGSLLNEVQREFEKDFWVNPYYAWLKNDRNLFTEEKYSNDGFTFMYFDFHDKAIEEHVLAQKKEDKEKPKI